MLHQPAFWALAAIRLQPVTVETWMAKIYAATRCELEWSPNLSEGTVGTETMLAWPSIINEERSFPDHI